LVQDETEITTERKASICHSSWSSRCVAITPLKKNLISLFKALPVWFSYMPPRRNHSSPTQCSVFGSSDLGPKSTKRKHMFISL